MSIRSKLNILVILAVVLALGPFAAYSLPWFSQSAQEEAKGDFRLIGALVVNVLQESYLSYISSQVELARNQKTVLREADLLISKLSADLNSLKPEEADRILDGQLAQFRRSGVFIFRLDPQGRPLGEGAPDSLGLLDWGTVRDITGQSLVEKMALGRVSPEGDFVIIESNDGSSADQITLLALLRPEPGGASFTVSLSSLEKARLQADLSAQNIVRQLSDRFHDVDLPPDASTVLMDRSRTILASKGPVPDLDPLTPELLERAALEGPLEVEVEFSEATGPIIARIEHFSSLDWYLLLLVPRSVVTEPVKQMAHKLLIYAILGALVAYCLSSSAGRKLSDPISALARKANEASRLDFSSPEAADFFQSRPKARPKEEIGSLEASFDTMCRTIVTNVKALLAANKARERLDGELAAARNIQLGILPPPGEANPPEGLEVAYVLEPAKEVGGDLYDTFTASDGRLALIIGDVSGKGVPA
ncbi:MAG: hypothetical protein LBE31_10855, partial [Deltaproteobacteria bacterium]|nr:hypothetical protein [Deltaproteobacteria bacterium]